MSSHSPNRVSAWYTTYFHWSGSLGCTIRPETEFDEVYRMFGFRGGPELDRLMDSERFGMFGITTVVFGGSLVVVLY